MLHCGNKVVGRAMPHLQKSAYLPKINDMEYKHSMSLILLVLKITYVNQYFCTGSSIGLPLGTGNIGRLSSKGIGIY